MIIGIGIDLVEVERVRRLLARHPRRGLKRLFTEAEVGYCAGSRNRYESLAARFAAKEALFKALGTGLAGGCAWRDVEVVVGATGAPSIALDGVTRRLAEQLGVGRIHLSLTHTGGLAGAYVVLEGEGRAARNESATS